MNLSQRDKLVNWHPYTQMKTASDVIGIVRGEGSYLFDEKGKRYIDAVASWWVNSHGHAHPYIAEKVSKQLSKLEHVIFAGFTHEPAVELSERLLKILPSNQKRVFYSDNGSTAVEVALKMAFQYWINKNEVKTKIIAFKNAYHGDTFGAMSVSERSIFTKPFSNHLFEVIQIELPDSDNELEVLNKFSELVETENVAAFIFEPLIQGASGMLMYEPEVLDQLLKICKDNDVLTIEDEVFTGFGRTGKMFASDYLKNKADIFCLSKGLTGGTMPLGVTTTTSAVYDAFLSDESCKTFFHGHSYTANPIACTSANASLDLFEKPETWDNIKQICDLVLEYKSRFNSNLMVKELRALGTILALEIYTDSESGYLNQIREFTYPYFLDKGIILRPLGNIIYIVPPFCMSKEDLIYVFETIENCLFELSKTCKTLVKE